MNNSVDAWTWEVVANGFISGGSDPFTGGAHGPEWDASGSITAVGPGTAFVPAFSGDAAVILSDGGICCSGGPGVDFG